jgi:hypothetical protein
MNLNRIRVPSLMAFLAILLLITPRAHGLTPGAPQSGYGQDRGDWDAPPREWNDYQRRGFHDGIEGARRDFDNHRRPDVDNRDEYRRPSVPPDVWGAYREGFRRGYDVAMSHLMGGPDWRMRAPERPWDAPPDELNDFQRRGFHDGIEGARKDFDNHRRPDVDNRDEYRHPQLPGPEREAYRDGFRRGYAAAMSHLMSDHDRDHDRDHDHDDHY